MRTGGAPTGTLTCGVATGYFTTRPSTKLYSRVASNVLRAARQLEVVLGTTPDGPSTQQLARVVALMQHHDAITGTDRFHVNQDYRKLIASGISEAQRVISRHVRSLLLSGGDQESGSSGSPDTGPRCDYHLAACCCQCNIMSLTIQHRVAGRCFTATCSTSPSASHLLNGPPVARTSMSSSTIRLVGNERSSYAFQSLGLTPTPGSCLVREPARS